MTPVTDPSVLASLQGGAPGANYSTLTPTSDPGATATDILKGAVKGFAQGGAMIASAPGDLGRMAETLTKLGITKLFPKLQAQDDGQSSVSWPTEQQFEQIGNIDKLPDAESTPGKHVQTVSTFLPGALGGPETILPNLIKRGLLPGIASDTLGTMFQGTSLEPYARVAGSLLSPSGVKKAPQVSADDLLTAGGNGRDQFRMLPYQTKPGTMDTWADNQLNGLATDQRGYRPAQTPQTTARLQAVKAGGGSMTADELDGLHYDLGQIAEGTTGRDSQAASDVQKALDQKIRTGLNQSNTLTGDAGVAAKTWADANDNYSRGKLLQSLDDTVQKSNDVSASVNSGAGSGNKLRTTFANFVNNDTKTWGMKQDEQDAMRNIVNGNLPVNMLRGASNKLGGGGGPAQMATMALAGHLGGIPAVLGAYMASKAARSIYNRGVASAADKMRAQIASRSPLAQSMPQPGTPAINPILARLIAAHAATGGMQ